MCHKEHGFRRTSRRDILDERKVKGEIKGGGTRSACVVSGGASEGRGRGERDGRTATPYVLAQRHAGFIDDVVEEVRQDDSKTVIGARDANQVSSLPVLPPAFILHAPLAETRATTIG